MTREQLLAIAKEAACAGRAALRSSREEATVVTADLSRDLKIQGDCMAEEKILAILKSTGIPVLTEESGSVGGADSGGPRWIVDPLDGTVNFARKIPLSCTSIGLWEGDKPVLGVIADQDRDELFWGLEGAGAFLNGEPIRPSVTRSKERGILCTGLPVAGSFAREGIESFIRASSAFKKVRLFGSAALSLAYVACGRADAYGERGVRIWDVAAGFAILRAAGGRTNHETVGNDPTILAVKASNGNLEEW
ncbi:MAG TPA: inositol monophosphatase family protein [Bdellovibrionota bacterium]|nr:inositol monophosphatase family protein [Bdellovibrionota bacterium]